MSAAMQLQRFQSPTMRGLTATAHDIWHATSLYIIHGVPRSSWKDFH